MDQLASQLPTGAPLSLINLLINLGIGVPLALLVRWHFERFGSTLSNRDEFAQVFPFILLTTTLIITVVKSSLALSLGLVGALSIVPLNSVRASVAYLSDEGEFRNMTPRAILGLPSHGEPTASDIRLLERQGAWRVVRGLPEGLDQPLSSTELSRRERRALVLGGILLGDSMTWVLDEPVETDGAKERARLEGVLEQAGDRTLVVSLRRPVCVDRFERIVVLRKGKIDFEGTPAEWRQRREQIRQTRA